MPPATGLSDRYDYKADAINVQGEMTEKLGIPYAVVQQPNGKASMDRPAHSCALRDCFTLLYSRKGCAPAYSTRIASQLLLAIGSISRTAQTSSAGELTAGEKSEV